MSRKQTISYVTKPGQRMGNSTYYLATTADAVQFYLFDEPKEGQLAHWSLIDQLDRTRLQGAGDKDTAKEWAKRLGLKNWSYVRI
ncbi:hypothetical protein [Dyella sp.]|uniref:hypothetical protein n=1 Tax=Dyella sp. TaxID=1869338 RepID=UPI002847537F|nr:hypothetical protein [Dyella sp.]MDR3446930.1 hypothetical protein [Dyella sp.]